MASTASDLVAWANHGSTARAAWEPLSGRVVWSSSMYRLFGLDPGAPVQFDSFLDHVHPHERNALEHLWGEHMRTMEPFAVMYRIIRKDGRVRPVEARGAFRVDELGNLERFELDLSYAD